MAGAPHVLPAQHQSTNTQGKEGMRRLHATQGRMQVLWEQVATPAQLPTTEQAQQEGTSEDIQQTQPQVLLTRDGPHMLPAKRVATPTHKG
jgi:hypothetical protein